MASPAERCPGSLRYFIRRDSRETGASGDIRSFLLSIGHQFAWRHPEAFRPERMQIAVTQRIESLGSGASAVGISIQDLVLSPFYRTSMLVDQHIETAEGDLIGVRIERAVVHERLLGREDLFNMALLDPAAVLTAEGRSDPIVVFVDGLDELRYTQPSDPILDLLANCPPLPANVRLVLSSREDTPLLAALRTRQTKWLREQSIVPEDQRVRADTLAYSGRRASEPTIARALAEQGGATRWGWRYPTRACGQPALPGRV
jgi:hypothetical protein